MLGASEDTWKWSVVRRLLEQLNSDKHVAANEGKRQVVCLDPQTSHKKVDSPHNFGQQLTIKGAQTITLRGNYPQTTKSSDVLPLFHPLPFYAVLCSLCSLCSVNPLFLQICSILCLHRAERIKEQKTEQREQRKHVLCNPLCCLCSVQSSVPFLCQPLPLIEIKCQALLLSILPMRKAYP